MHNDKLLTGTGSKSSLGDTVGQLPGISFASNDPKASTKNVNFRNPIMNVD